VEGMPPLGIQAPEVMIGTDAQRIRRRRASGGLHQRRAGSHEGVAEAADRQASADRAPGRLQAAVGLPWARTVRVPLRRRQHQDLEGVIAGLRERHIPTARCTAFGKAVAARGPKPDVGVIVHPGIRGEPAGGSVLRQPNIPRRFAARLRPCLPAPAEAVGRPGAILRRLGGGDTGENGQAEQQQP